jgi:hypothetical protein
VDIINLKVKSNSGFDDGGSVFLVWSLLKGIVIPANILSVAYAIHSAQTDYLAEI